MQSAQREPPPSPTTTAHSHNRTSFCAARAAHAARRTPRDGQPPDRLRGHRAAAPRAPPLAVGAPPRQRPCPRPCQPFCERRRRRWRRWWRWWGWGWVGWVGVGDRRAVHAPEPPGGGAAGDGDGAQGAGAAGAPTPLPSPRRYCHRPCRHRHRLAAFAVAPSIAIAPSRSPTCLRSPVPSWCRALRRRTLYCTVTALSHTLSFTRYRACAGDPSAAAATGGRRCECVIV